MLAYCSCIVCAIIFTCDAALPVRLRKHYSMGKDEECPQLSSGMRGHLSADGSALKEWQKTFWSMAESANAAKKASPRRTSTKIAYAFLLKDKVSMPLLWEAYFASQAPKSFKLLVHVHETFLSEASKLPPTLRAHLTQGAMPTSEWCHLGELQFAMARKLLEDRAVTHIVWLSGDSVPVRSPKAVNAALQIGKSFFCPDTDNDKAEMWHALARPHAEALVAAESTVFELYHKTHHYCEDEAIFWPMLAVAGAPNNELLKRCVMWTDWFEGSPFHRPTWNLLGHGENSGSDHPMSFKLIPTEGLNALVSGNNEALFARKFPENACVVDSTGMPVGSLEEALLSSLGLASTANATKVEPAPKTFLQTPQKNASEIDIYLARMKCGVPQT